MKKRQRQRGGRGGETDDGVVGKEGETALGVTGVEGRTAEEGGEEEKGRVERGVQRIFSPKKKTQFYVFVSRVKLQICQRQLYKSAGCTKINFQMQINQRTI